MIISLKRTPDVRPCDAGDLDRLRWIRREAFRRPLDDEHWLKRGRVLLHDGVVQAGLCLDRTTQFFGGRAVPVTLADTLMVAPEARGRGIGKALLSQVLQEEQRSGSAMFTLYATTLPFYRKLGWELAGARYRYRAPMPSSTTVGESVKVEPWTDADLPDVARCYRETALHTNGFVERSREWWQSKVTFEIHGEPVYRYLVREHGKVTAYVIYTQQQIPSLLHHYSIECRDFIWSTPAGAYSLLNFFAQQRMLAKALCWSGPPDDPLRLLYDQMQVELQWTYHWLSRPVNIPAALEARGYPTDVRGSLDLSVEDAGLPRSSGPVRLSVEEGRARISPGLEGGPSLTPGAFAAIYTGWIRPRDAARLGCLRKATSADLGLLEALFAGPPPWLMDDF
jgi:predicted acetyltransferase